MRTRLPLPSCRRIRAAVLKRPTSRAVSLTFAILIMSSHLLARRVGEAANPGPDGAAPHDLTRRGPSQERQGGLSIVTGNGTGWVPIRAWLRESEHHVICTQEHRQLHPEDVAAASEAAFCSGWKSFWAPAIPSQHDAGEPSGGTAIFVRGHLGAREPPGGPIVYPGHCVASLVDAGGTGGVVVYSCYLRCGGELGPYNWAILTAVAEHAKGHGLPFCIGADWNCTPEVLAHSGWVAAMGALVVKAPVSHTVTIRGRPGRHIDYYVISKCLADLGVSASIDARAPIKTHNAIATELPAKPRSYHITAMRAPKRMPVDRPIGPRKEPSSARCILQRARRATELALAGNTEGATVLREEVVKEWFDHAEEELIKVYHLDEQPQGPDAYRGRSKGQKFVREPILGASRRRARPEAGAESRRLRLLQDRAYELAAAFDRRQAHPDAKEIKERARAAIDAGHHVAANAPSNVRSGGIAADLKRCGRAAERWTRTSYQDADGAHEDARRSRSKAWEIGEAARDEAEAIETERARDVRNSISEWCKKAEANGASLAHKWSKLPVEWRAETTDVVAAEVVTTSTNPDDLVNAERAKWSKLWAPSGGPSGLPHWGTVPVLPRPTVEELRACARRFKRTTGQGADLISPRDLAELEDDALGALGEVMYLSEILGTMPDAMSLVIVVLISKKDGGRRPVGLMPAAYRLWAKVRQGYVRRWEAQWDRRYLAAARGKSATDVAWVRSLRAEYAASSGATAASILWDLRKCFDHGSHVLLASEAKELMFPLAVARLSVAMYTAERRLRLDNAFSQPIRPTRGFIAGCTNALAAIKATMIRRMDIFVTRNPRADLDIYVDDVEMQAIGPRTAVVDDLVRAAADMRAALVDDLDYPLADDKAVIIASDPEVAREIATRTEGKAGRVQAVTAKLGIEFTSGARRPTIGGPRRARYKRQVARRRRLSKLRKLGCRIIDVVRRGQLPAATYGGAVHGVSDHELELLRAMTSAAVSPTTRGTSRTLKLLMAGDPAIEANTKVLIQWASAIWRACGPAISRRRSDPTPVLMNAALRRAEAQARDPSKGSWSAVAGPAMAAVLTAKRIGWMFMSAFRISDDRGNVVDLATTDPMAVKHLIERATCAEAARRAAAKEGVGGDGAEIWVGPVRRALASKMSPSAKASLRRAFAGGYWTNSRRAEQGLTPHSTCDKCGHRYDDKYHRIWECIDLDEMRCKYTSPELRERAARAERDSLYWTRGIAEDPWRNLVPPRRDYTEDWYFRAGVERDRNFTGEVFSDGSAIHPRCPEARRAGWTVLQIDERGDVEKAVFGHVPAAESTTQSAGSGETYALRRAQELAVGGITTTADYQALLDGAEAGQLATTAPSRTNAAHWRGIWKATDGEPPAVVKVKAHRTYEEVMRSDVLGDVRAWKGNRAADLFAKKGARMHSGTDGHAAGDRYEQQFDELVQVCRWIGIALSQWTHAPRGMRKPTRNKYDAIAQTKARRRAEAAEKHGHRLVRDRDGWRCLTCGKCAVASSGARKLAMGRCPGHTGGRIGQQGPRPAAHVLWAAEADPTHVGPLPPDVVWCSRCGGYSSTKLYKLGTVCSGVLQRAAQDRLNWFNRGRHPVLKHVLSAPVRLTDAVVKALGEGAAKRRAAFNAVLRGDPRLDDRRQTVDQGLADTAAGDGLPHLHPHDDDHGGFPFDDMTDDFDYDVFGHGGSIDGGGSSEVDVSGGGWEGKPQVDGGRGSRPGSSDDHLGKGSTKTFWDGDGERSRQHSVPCWTPRTSTDDVARRSLADTPCRALSPGDAVGGRRLRTRSISHDADDVGRDDARLGDDARGDGGAGPRTKRSRLGDSSGSEALLDAPMSTARASQVVYREADISAIPCGTSASWSSGACPAGGCSGDDSQDTRRASACGTSDGRQTIGERHPVSLREQHSESAQSSARPPGVGDSRAPTGDRQRGGRAARARLSEPPASPPARGACCVVPHAEREIKRRRLWGKQPPPVGSVDARASASWPVPSPAVDQHEADACARGPSA